MPYPSDTTYPGSDVFPGLEEPSGSGGPLLPGDDVFPGDDLFPGIQDGVSAGDGGQGFSWFVVEVTSEPVAEEIEHSRLVVVVNETVNLRPQVAVGPWVAKVNEAVASKVAVTETIPPPLVVSNPVASRVVKATESLVNRTVRADENVASLVVVNNVDGPTVEVDE